MDNKIIACDFDGVLCENQYPEIGPAKDDVIRYIKQEQEKGSKIILWTCRAGRQLGRAISWAKKNGIVFDAVNENIPDITDRLHYDPRKVYADEYLEGKSISLSKLNVAYE